VTGRRRSRLPSRKMRLDWIERGWDQGGGSGGHQREERFGFFFSLGCDRVRRREDGFE